MDPFRNALDSTLSQFKADARGEEFKVKKLKNELYSKLNTITGLSADIRQVFQDKISSITTSNVDTSINQLKRLAAETRIEQKESPKIAARSPLETMKSSAKAVVEKKDQIQFAAFQGLLGKLSAPNCMKADDVDKLSKILQENFPKLNESQKESLKAHLEQKIGHIQNKAANGESIDNDLKGIISFVEHNVLRTNMPWGGGVSLFAHIPSLNKEFFASCAKTPENHPEWCYFLGQAQTVFPHASEQEIKAVFAKLMDGAAYEMESIQHSDTAPATTIREITGESRNKGIDSPLHEGATLFIREQASADTKKPDAADPEFMSRYEESSSPEDVSFSQTKSSQVYASARQALFNRLSNPYYKEAFMLLQKLDTNNEMFLDHRPGFNDKTASLWSGGFAISEHASKEHRVLEMTKLGNLFNGFEQHTDHLKIQFPLWYQLSAGFVEAEMKRQIAEGKEPTLFYHFRTADPLTVGTLVESTTMMYNVLSRGKELSLTLVPMFTSGGMPKKGTEITVKANRSNFDKELKAGMGKYREQILAIKNGVIDIYDAIMNDPKLCADSRLVELSKSLPEPTEAEIKAELQRLGRGDDAAVPLTDKELMILKISKGYDKSALATALQNLEKGPMAADPRVVACRQKMNAYIDNRWSIDELADTDKIGKAKAAAKKIAKEKS